MAQLTLRDVSLKDHKLTDRVRRLRDVYFKSLPQICVERLRLLTMYHFQNGLFDKDRISTPEPRGRLWKRIFITT